MWLTVSMDESGGTRQKVSAAGIPPWTRAAWTTRTVPAASNPWSLSRRGRQAPRPVSSWGMCSRAPSPDRSFVGSLNS